VRRVVLGVDPGSRNTGFGVVEEEGERLLHLASGGINAGSRPSLELRLRQIYDGLSALIRQHQPQALALEEIFLAANVRSALTLGQVRGVVLLAAAQASLPIFYYPPLVVKKAVVGYGQASKAQVQLMVEHLLGLKITNQHAADALAVGMCHLFHCRWPDPSR
jgi:crossover junction endodeoxyribonuclease RuvC